VRQAFFVSVAGEPGDRASCRPPLSLNRCASEFKSRSEMVLSGVSKREPRQDNFGSLLELTPSNGK
jgi:hypothetical protein